MSYRAALRALQKVQPVLAGPTTGSTAGSTAGPTAGSTTGSTAGARVDAADRDPDVWPSDCFQHDTGVLARKNPFPQDARIRFVESTHKYYIDGNEAETSCTSLVHAPFPGFDARQVIPNMASRSSYGSMTDRQIARSWASKGTEASNLGTTMHAAIEVYLNTGYWSQDSRIQTELAMAKDFMAAEIEARGLVPFRTEPTIYVEGLGSESNKRLPGSVDAVFRDPATGELWVCDWKRVKGLVPTMNGRYGWGEFPPFDRIENIKACHYSLQLHVYRYILVNCYGYNVPKDKLYMVTFHPSNASYQMIRAFDYAEQAAHLLDNFDAMLVHVRRHKEIDEAVDHWRDEEDDDGDDGETVDPVDEWFK